MTFEILFSPFLGACWNAWEMEEEADENVEA